jgi:hypothetical protein
MATFTGSTAAFLEDVGYALDDSIPPRNLLYDNTLADLTATYRTLRETWDNQALAIEGIVGAILAPPAPPTPTAAAQAGATASQQPPANTPSIGSLTAAETDLMLRMIMGEAGGEPYDGQVAVVAAVLNYKKYVGWDKRSITQLLKSGGFNESYINPNTRHWYSVPLNAIPALDIKRRAVADALAGRHKIGKRNHWYSLDLVNRQGLPYFARKESRLTIGGQVFFSEKGTPF